jgi:Dolichyl-phosphate-mannose-protein mannosyltransferase
MKTELAGSSPPLNEPTNRSPSRSKRRVTVIVVIFLLAFGVRFITWHDTRLEVGKVQYGVTADYKRIAQMMRDGGIRAFLNSTSPLANPNTLGHPPGYSILLAITDSIYSNPHIQFLQITIDALSAVVIFLIVAELFSLGTATLAGLLAAFAPQFAWNSVLLLPDTLAVFPILLAVYLLVRATKRPRLLTFIIIGALIGISCWLRANAMLMTVFFAVAVPLLLQTRERASRMLATRPQGAGAPNGAPKNAPVWRYSLAIVAGTILLIAPLTIRNAIVFHRFIPISLGAGQTLLEGIADYDPERQFGIPPTDVEIQQQEADSARRPEYAKALFDPDGIDRERARLSRGFAVIRSHPFWFAGVMARRASMMIRLERTPVVAGLPDSPRLLIYPVQKLFLTAVMLPLTIIGLPVVIFRKQSRALVILSIVPVYYFSVQSMVHTEYRYVLPVVYFMFAFAAAGIAWIAGNLVGAGLVPARTRAATRAAPTDEREPAASLQSTH